MKAMWAVGVGLIAVGAVLAQGAPSATNNRQGSAGASTSTGSGLEFEVASVKVAEDTNPNQVRAGLRMDGSQAHFASLSLKSLVTMAYRVEGSQVSGPDWISQQRFDIDAKLPDGGTTDQIPEMLQSLLADRFALKLHHDTKEGAAYALVMGKAPLALTKVEDDSAGEANGAVSLAAQGSAAGISIDLGNGSSYTFADNKFDFKKIAMDRLAIELARYLDRPVVNMTGLKGKYDFTLTVTQEDYTLLLIRSGVNAGIVLPPQAIAYMESSSPTSFFEAIDHAGLHLDSRKMPLDLIVVDSALQKPNGN